MIEFYSDNSLSQDASPTATIENLSEHILSDIKTGNFSSVKQNMLSLYSQIIANPALIGQTNTPDKLGKAFVLMLSNRISSDDDIIESIACIAYVLVSKAIILNPTPNNYLDRLLIMQFSREQFNYSIQSALDVSEGDSDDFFSPVGQMGGTKARDEIFKMEIADLYSNPVLYQQLDLIKRKKEEFDDMIADNFFYNMTLPLLIEEGKANHEKAYNYFQNKIIINQDINV